MKALSVSQPFAWSMFDPIANKDIENRSWPPPPKMIGEMIAIHAAKSWIDEQKYACQMHEECKLTGNYAPLGYFRHHGIEHAPRKRELYVAGAIIGVATIAGVVTDMEARGLPPLSRRWYFGPFGWLIPDRRALSKAIVIGGKQGLWTVPELLENEIRQQLGLVN